MFDRNYSSSPRLQSLCQPANWESDIADVSVEACNMEEDPSGYRVIFYKNNQRRFHQDDESYSIGASYLKNRLDKLARAGFDAPMTQKAMNLIDQQRIKRIAV